MTAVARALNLVPRIGGDRAAGARAPHTPGDGGLHGGCLRSAGSASTSDSRWSHPAGAGRRAGVVQAHRVGAYRGSRRRHWRTSLTRPHASYGKYGAEIFVDEESDGSAVDASQDDLNLVGALVDQDAIDAQAAEQERIDAEMLERLEKLVFPPFLLARGTPSRTGQGHPCRCIGLDQLPGR